ncbi:mechanosensitive ion channel family protein [Natronorubrum aibiense]|uniref:Mechanosensitive ion channel n=1 Tax=Natronorubrum aibiense TaxID=348826 RepID=A0A5P9P0J5_9EURY|nr:mechanosensitive ion channel family protein [Natronorubrum aibiense]QFU81669.1 mechanosensitive ion channel [Natronorubrum aibiense]
MVEVVTSVLTRVFEGVPAWQATLLLIGTSVGLAVLLEVLVLRTLLRYTSRTKTEYDYILVGELRAPVVLTAALTGVYLLTQLPSVSQNVLLTSAQLETFFGRPSLSIIIVAWAFASNRIVNRFVEEVKDKGSRFDFAPVFSNVWTLVVVIGTIGVLLSLWEYSISPLLGAAGVAGIAVGFAARDTVANFFGGIALYFDDTYKLGDYIELDSGEAGTVVKVGVRSTTLMMRDEVLVTVPNASLNAAKVINQSAPQRRRRLKVPIGVAYGTDIDVFEELVTEIAIDEPLVLDSPKPRMRFRAFGDSALEYELLCWVGSPTRANKTRHELNRSIYTELLAADIEIPFPQRDVRVVTEADRSPQTSLLEDDSEKIATGRQ